MKAVLYEEFRQPPRVTQVPDPVPVPGGVVLRVQATGVCRSDWHGWMGHDPDIVLPHVPGHELAGIIEAIGPGVRNWKVGDRVTVPFVCACGTCPECHSGNQQVCDHQFQPGFTHWGSFAEYVAIPQADLNLVALPETMDYATAASLGCRFATSFRAVVRSIAASQLSVLKNTFITPSPCVARKADTAQSCSRPGSGAHNSIPASQAIDTAMPNGAPVQYASIKVAPRRSWYFCFASSRSCTAIMTRFTPEAAIFLSSTGPIVVGSRGMEKPVASVKVV